MILQDLSFVCVLLSFLGLYLSICKPCEVDLSLIETHVGLQMRNCLSNEGFLILKNHKIPIHLFYDLERQMKSFFDLEAENKRHLANNRNLKWHFGYIGDKVEMTGGIQDRREIFNFAPFPSHFEQLYHTND